MKRERAQTIAVGLALILATYAAFMSTWPYVFGDRRFDQTQKLIESLDRLADRLSPK